MQDRSFAQAVHDLHDQLSNEFLDSIHNMLEYRTTVTKATLAIQDENRRTVVSKTLIVGQVITLLALMKDMHILHEEQYSEFRTYLLNTLATE
ncbi:MAG: hypothetical protein E6J34_11805 [Chloroflexi bacterium]|nr:MAG: hypothetical protein E6J34_11805 [Chloroflexota bacterium]